MRASMRQQAGSRNFGALWKDVGGVRLGWVKRFRGKIRCSIICQEFMRALLDLDQSFNWCWGTLFVSRPQLREELEKRRLCFSSIRQDVRSLRRGVHADELVVVTE